MLRRRVFRPLMVLALCGVPLWAQAFCFDAAAAKYHVSPLLIKSMAIGESNLDSLATNDNRDKNGENQKYRLRTDDD